MTRAGFFNVERANLTGVGIKEKRDNKIYLELVLIMTHMIFFTNTWTVSCLTSSVGLKSFISNFLFIFTSTLLCFLKIEQLSIMKTFH